MIYDAWHRRMSLAAQRAQSIFTSVMLICVAAALGRVPAQLHQGREIPKCLLSNEIR